MIRETISTDKAPKAIGPYEQAIKVGDFVYTAGQIPIDPQTGNLVAGGIAEQTRQVLENLKARLGSRRLIPRPRRQSHGVFEKHGRLRGAERSLRRIPWQGQAGPLDRRGGGFAARRAGRDRSRRDGLIIGAQAKFRIELMALRISPVTLQIPPPSCERLNDQLCSVLERISDRCQDSLPRHADRQTYPSCRSPPKIWDLA